MAERYSPPAGYYDQPFFYVFDGNILTDGQNALNNSVEMTPGIGDFILRRIVGVDRLVNTSSPTGRFWCQARSGAYIESQPVNIQGGGEFAVAPELEYPDQGHIVFDLYTVLKAT
jgi:hypothetical protein